MRRLLIFTIVACFACATTAIAQDPCTPEAIIKAYLEKKHYSNEPFKVVAFDHTNREWHAWQWDGINVLTLPHGTFEIPHTNEPTLYLGRNDHVAVLAFNTNPLLYTAALTSSTEAPIKSLESLQQFAALFGGAAATAIAGLNTAKQQEVGPGLAAHVESLHPSIGHDPYADLRKATDVLSAALNATNPAVERKLNAAGKDGEKATKELNELDRAQDAAFVHLQLIESRPSNASALDGTGIDALFNNLQSSFSDLRTSTQELRDTPGDCPSAIAVADAVFVAILDGRPADARSARIFDDEWDDAVEALQHKHLTACSSETAASLEAIRSWMRQNRPSKPASGALQSIIADARKRTSAAVTLNGKRAATLDAANKILDAESGPLRRAVQLERLIETQKANYKSGEPLCHLTAGVIEIKRVEGHDLDLPWSKVRTEEMSLNVVPTFKDNIDRVRADETKTKYNFARRGVKLDVDTALIYTNITDREFKAVANNPKDDSAGFVVKETSQNTRTGNLALMLTATPETWRRFGLQLGFGFDTGNPAMFAGFAFKPFDFIRLSAGRTWQKVTKLGDSSTLGSTIASADALQTRKSFDNDWYYSLAFTITDLPIFKNK